MKKRLLLAMLVVCLGAAFYGGTVLATTQSGVSTTIYAKSTFARLNLRGFAFTPGTRPPLWLTDISALGASDVYVVDNKIAPGGTTGWHSHPGPSLIHVVSGTVTNYQADDPSCTPHVYSAGSGFVDPGGESVHMLRNEGSVPAETIAVQFLPQGATRRIEKPEPVNCNL
jgi:quercetin dioxygenase-like cupin family protein